ncbi:MAG: hypothetical protein A2031_03100 [Deltaproteobacteria bacterium RBG_19FT_COMBO_43_11]|nr:MAG: hypothetical protein A2031_03100 [Deltaproteobacteria bacterium RBG_19FT_COMBO_43_11]
MAERKDKADMVSTKGSTGHFGIAAQDITAEMAKHLGISRDAGVIVTEVQSGSPADDVGIQPQDIIVQVNRVKINSMKSYTREISKAIEKKSVTLLIRRGNSSFFVALQTE